MQGYELVNLLADHGFSLRVEDGRLAVSPASRLTDDIRQAIRVYKPAIIELAHSLDELIEAWRRGPRTTELGEKLKAASVLQPVVRSFSYEPASEPHCLAVVGSCKEAPQGGVVGRFFDFGIVQRQKRRSWAVWGRLGAHGRE